MQALTSTCQFPIKIASDCRIRGHTRCATPSHRTKDAVVDVSQLRTFHNTAAAAAAAASPATLSTTTTREPSRLRLVQLVADPLVCPLQAIEHALGHPQSPQEILILLPQLPKLSQEVLYLRHSSSSSYRLPVKLELETSASSDPSSELMIETHLKPLMEPKEPQP